MTFHEKTTNVGNASLHIRRMHSEVVHGSFRQMSFHWLLPFLNPTELRLQIATCSGFYLESSIRDYRAYFRNLKETIAVGDILHSEVDSNNPHDQFAIAVKTFSDETVGHVPIELSQIFWEFLSSHEGIEAE